MKRTGRPHPLYRVPMFYVPRPPRPRRSTYVEGADFDELKDDMRRMGRREHFEERYGR